MERFGSRLSCTVHHLRTVWERRQDANVELFHYADMRRNPQGQLRRLAAALGIDVPDDAWPALVEATSFESMKRHAEDVAPNAAEGLWHDAGRFFAEARHGSWRVVLSDDALARYERRLDELCPEPDLKAWLYHGWTS